MLIYHTYTALFRLFLPCIGCLENVSQRLVKLKEALNKCHFEHSEKSITLIVKDSSLRSK